MWFYFLQGATLGLSASATPGPFLAFLMAQTIKNGWRPTLPASLAPLISDGPIVFLVLLVLTQTPAWLLDGLRLAGAVFMFYLAWGALRAARQRHAVMEPSPAAAGQSVLKGAMMNALSPGPYIFWGVLAGPIVLQGWRQSPTLGLSFVGGFYSTLIGGFALFVLLFATARRLGPQVNRGLSAVSAAALLGFGLYQLYTGLMGLAG